MIVTDEAYPYLVAQRGGLDHLKGDRAAWERAYADELAETLGNIGPWLPETCGAILDVGGGMGGIDALLYARYGAPKILILDGVDDPAVASQHDQTFNNATVALDFLAANRVPYAGFMRAADRMSGFWLADLIVSFQAWGFHFPPETYLSFVANCCHPGTVLVLDLRKGKPSWYLDLCKRFEFVAWARHAGKYDRAVFRAR